MRYLFSFFLGYFQTLNIKNYKRAYQKNTQENKKLSAFRYSNETRLQKQKTNNLVSALNGFDMRCLQQYQKTVMQKRSVNEAIRSQKPSQTLKLIDSRYEIKNIYLGEGTFGEVFACWDKVASQVLAAKTISKAKILQKINRSKGKQKTKEFYVKSLQNQALLMQNIDHPNIIRFYGCSQNNSHLYFFIQYCNQGSLQAMIERSGPLTPKIALPLMRQVLSALAYLHRKSICHRDIKPLNILLHNGDVKLSDFGFAVNLTDTDKTTSVYSVGTEEYMAPEVLAESRFSPKSDVWSLGVTFYRMLCGENPWKFIKDQREWLRRVRQVPPMNCSVPLWVKTAIGKMLTFDDGLRPSVQDIEHFFIE